MLYQTSPQYLFRFNFPPERMLISPGSRLLVFIMHFCKHYAGAIIEMQFTPKCWNATFGYTAKAGPMVPCGYHPPWYVFALSFSQITSGLGYRLDRWKDSGTMNWTRFTTHHSITPSCFYSNLCVQLLCNNHAPLRLWVDSTRRTIVFQSNDLCILLIGVKLA